MAGCGEAGKIGNLEVGSLFGSKRVRGSNRANPRTSRFPVDPYCRDPKRPRRNDVVIDALPGVQQAIRRKSKRA